MSGRQPLAFSSFTCTPQQTVLNKNVFNELNLTQCSMSRAPAFDSCFEGHTHHLQLPIQCPKRACPVYILCAGLCRHYLGTHTSHFRLFHTLITCTFSLAFQYTVNQAHDIRQKALRRFALPQCCTCCTCDSPHNLTYDQPASLAGGAHLARYAA